MRAYTEHELAALFRERHAATLHDLAEANRKNRRLHGKVGTLLARVELWKHRYNVAKGRT